MGVIGFVGAIALVILVSVLILKIIDRITSGRDSPEARAESERRFRERLERPKFGELEQHFGCRIPAALVDLFSDVRLVEGGELEVEGSRADSDETFSIAWFCPQDAESLRHALFDATKYMPIAGDGFGNCYLIDPRQDDPAVLLHDHETGQFEKVCERLSLFAVWIRSAGGTGKVAL